MDNQNQCEKLQADQPELTTKQLEMEICRLNAQLWKRRRMDIAEHKERSIAQIGRCFKNNYGQYVIVAHVPEEIDTMGGTEYNRYQFPGIWLNNELVPFEVDTVFSGVWGDGNPRVLDAKYEEITPEEFLQVFDERIQQLRNTVARLIDNREKYEGGQGGG